MWNAYFSSHDFLLFCKCETKPVSGPNGTIDCCQHAQLFAHLLLQCVTWSQLKMYFIFYKVQVYAYKGQRLITMLPHFKNRLVVITKNSNLLRYSQINKHLTFSILSNIMTINALSHRRFPRIHNNWINIRSITILDNFNRNWYNVFKYIV